MARISTAAGIACLCLPALATAQEGHFGQGHDLWHEQFYNGLGRPDGFNCCSNADCRPTSQRVSGDHYEVKLDGEWIAVPPERILHVTAPDLGAHICAPRQAAGTRDVVELHGGLNRVVCLQCGARSAREIARV